MKVLNVDDNKLITEALEFAFQALGHDFSFTNSGKDAVEMIRNNSYDAVFLDVAMPEFSGTDVIKELDTTGSIKDYNIVLLTASTIDDDEMKWFIEKGVRGVIKKPIDITRLEKEISEIFSP